MAVSVPFTGGCACGAIRYECSAEPIMSFNCHCRDCQRMSGTAFASALAVSAAAFTLTQGEPKFFEKKGDSGNTVLRGFCPDCGSPLMGKFPESPDVIGLLAGSLDDPSGHQPTVDIWTKSAHPWDYMNPALEKFETEPPASE